MYMCSKWPGEQLLCWIFTHEGKQVGDLMFSREIVLYYIQCRLRTLLDYIHISRYRFRRCKAAVATQSVRSIIARLHHIESGTAKQRTTNV